MPILASFSALPARGLGLANFVVAGKSAITSIDTDVNGTTGGQVDIYFTPGTVGTIPVTNYEYSTDGGSTWTALSPKDTTSPLRVTGLTNGQEYDFAIRSSQDGVPSTASDVVTATPVALPGAPSITFINEDANGTTGGKVDISFSAGSAGTNATTQYQYRINSGAWTNAGTTSPFSVTGLANGTTYSFTMRAVMGSFVSAASTAVNGRPVALPAAPSITFINEDANGTTGGKVDIYFTAGAQGTDPDSSYQYSINSGAWTNAGTSSPFTISSLANGTTYSFRVRTVMGSYVSAASTAVSGRPVALPAAPSITFINEDANGTTGGKVDIYFTAGAAGTDSTTSYQYRIGSGSWQSAGTSSPFTVTGLTNGTTYSFRVRAVMGSYVSAQSSAVNGRPVALPTAPTISSVNATTGALSISFSASSAGTDAISTYQYSLNNGSTWNNRPSGTTASPISGISVTDSDVVGGDYDGKVRIRAKAGSYFSSASNAGTPSHPGPGRPPAPTVTATPTSLTFSWSASTTGAYAIDRYQYEDTDSTWENVGTTAGERTQTFTGLTPSSTYGRKFRAVDAQGQVSASRSATGTTSAEVPPGTPSAPTVSASGTTSLSVDYSTTTAGTYPIGKYQYQIAGGIALYKAAAVDIGSDPFTISSLNVDEEYKVRIRAVSTTGLAGPWSADGYGTTDPNTPSASTLSFRSTNASERSVAKLQWTAQTYASTYHLYKKTNGGADTFVGAYTGTEADVAVSALSSYQFFVYAGNRIGNFSGVSNSKYMTVGAKNQELKININEFGPNILAGRLNLGVCGNTGSLFHYWGYVPSSSDSAGYKRVDQVGYQLQLSPGTLLQTACSTGSRSIYINVSSASNRVGGSGTMCPPVDFSNWYIGYDNVSVGGSSLNNGYLQLYAEGSGWAFYNNSCNISDSRFTLYLRNLFAVGVQTTASTYS